MTKRVHPKQIELKLIQILSEADRSESVGGGGVQDEDLVRRKWSASSTCSSASFASSAASDLSEAAPSSCHFQNRALDELSEHYFYFQPDPSRTFCPLVRPEEEVAAAKAAAAAEAAAAAAVTRRNARKNSSALRIIRNKWVVAFLNYIVHDIQTIHKNDYHLSIKGSKNEWMDIMKETST